MTQLSEVLQHIEQLWPARLAQEWDAPGLLVGHPDDSVTRVLLVVDTVSATVEEALGGEFDLVLAHHPLLFRAVTTVAATTYRGALIRALTRSGCGLVAAHTNADAVPTGTSQVLAQALGLGETQVLDPVPGDHVAGVGCIGRLPAPVSFGELASRLARVLPATARGVAGAGDYSAPVRTVAVCAGSGDAYLERAAACGADVYLTADLRHHPALDAREQARIGDGKPYLLAVSHWASEWLWLEQARRELGARLPGVDFVVSELNTDPWDFVVTQ